MPNRAPRPCSTPGCPVLLQPRERCPVHQGDTRPSAARRGYDARWRKRRARFLRTHPTCADCGGRATIPDHAPYTRRQLLAMGVDDPDRDEYLQPRCKPCHDARSAATTPGGWNQYGNVPRD